MAALTEQQKTTFRNEVKSHVADTVATAYQARDIDTLLAWYNGLSATTVWRNDVKPSELAGSIVMSEFLSAAFVNANKQPAMNLLMQLGAGGLDATNANVRTSFQTIWSGTTTLTNLTTLAQRRATRLEAIAGFLTPAAPANTVAAEVYGHVFTRVELGQILWDAQGNPL